jgi:hypothetical protein
MMGKIICALTLLALLLVLSACGKPLEEVGPPLQSGVWKESVMTNGPSVYWACFKGDRIYALQPLAERGRAGLWPGASIAAVKGGCRDGR